jgi:hypothetical protein
VGRIATSWNARDGCEGRGRRLGGCVKVRRRARAGMSGVAATRDTRDGCEGSGRSRSSGIEV